MLPQSKHERPRHSLSNVHPRRTDAVCSLMRRTGLRRAAARRGGAGRPELGGHQGESRRPQTELGSGGLATATQTGTATASEAGRGSEKVRDRRRRMPAFGGVAEPVGEAEGYTLQAATSHRRRRAATESAANGPLARSMAPLPELTPQAGGGTAPSPGRRRGEQEAKAQRH